jgi:glycine dehydrogenase
MADHETTSAPGAAVPAPGASAPATVSATAPLTELENAFPFETRHIGPGPEDQAKMLALLGYGSLDELAEAAVPATIRMTERLGLSPAHSEAEVTAELRDLAARNRVLRPMIGLGYYGTITPPVIRRNVLENPAWYTAYTPYQPEISQGRLEALLNFQTVVADLTALPVANASLLDEGTAAAEAMSLARRIAKNGSATFLVDADLFPQTLAVLQTRAEPAGIELVAVDLSAGSLPDVEFFGVLAQYPGASGAVRDLSAVASAAHERGALVAVAADLLALTLLRAPGEFRGHRGGYDAAVRRAARLRRAARRVHRRARRPGALAARPPGGHVPGR